ncbi:MAG: hypothetical protein AAFO84_04800 [Cyanobacteria bacterium J06598_1]
MMTLLQRCNRFVRLTTVCVAAFALTTLGVRLWVGSAASRQDDSLSVKLAHFEANKNSYSAVFIGNSRIYRGVNPKRFDEVMITSGRASHSYNFGIPAMTAAEINKVVRYVVAADPCCLDYVFVELWSPAHLVSVRANRTVASYDPMTAWFALQHTLGAEGSLVEKGMLSAEIMAAAGLNVLNVGGLLHTLPEHVSRNGAPGDDEVYNGYTPLEVETHADILRRRDKFETAGGEAFAQLVAEQLKAYERRPGLEPYQENALALLDRYVEKLDGDTELIYLVTPFGKSYRVDDTDLSVFDYNDVTAHPNLFDRSLWFDEGHLTEEGAGWLSQDLARKVMTRETP